MSRLVQNTRLLIKIVSVVAILVVANIVVAQWDYKWDMTKSGLYSLSEQSRTIAEGLDRDVEITFFHFEGGQGRIAVDPLWVRTLLKGYADHSDRIHFREINPNVSPSEAREYQIRQNNTVVVEVGQKHEKLAPRDLVNFSRRGSNSFRGEVAVTNAIKNLTTVTDRTVWFLTGHGEMTPTGSQGRTVSTLRRAIQNSGFSVDSLNPLNDELPPKQDLVVMLDPQSSLSPTVIDRINGWHTSGGNLLVAGNPQHRSAVNSVIESLGARIQDRQILGQNWQFYYQARGNPFLLVPSLHSHPVTDPLAEEGISVRMGRSSPLEIDTNVLSPLLQSASEAYAKPLREGQRRLDPAFDGDEDVRGPFTVGAVSNGGDTGAKLMVFSNADVFSDEMLGQAGNEDFAMNIVNWFLERQISLDIEPKSLSGNVVENITPMQAYTIQMISLVVIPFTVLIWGLAVWWKRKNL